MIERYSREDMKKIWSLENKFQTFLDVEIAVCEAYQKIGVISQEVLQEIKSSKKTK